jgi:phage I-like protein
MNDDKKLIIMVCKADVKDMAIALVCKDLNGIVPMEIQVIPYGFHQTPKGDFTCDEESAEMVISTFAAQINDMVADYEHQTLHGGEAPAAGWIKELINKGHDGIWAVMEWTEKAKQYIANKEYRYVSPVFLKRVSDNKVVRLINIALTNQPNIDGMVPLINKLSADSFQLPANKKEEVIIMWKDLLALLGLPETATEAEAIAAFKAMMAEKEVVANKAVLTALGLAEGAGESEVIATVMANKQGHDTITQLTQQVNKLTDQLKVKESEDVEAMVNKAIEGDEKGSKLTPAQKDWALKYAKEDVEGFKVFLNKAPYAVIKDKIAGEQGGGSDALDASQVQVNKQMGIDTDTFKKFGPKEDK